jgi:hypothetical protein
MQRRPVGVGTAQADGLAEHVTAAHRGGAAEVLVFDEPPHPGGPAAYYRAGQVDQARRGCDNLQF